MNVFDSFCKSLYNRTVRDAKLRGFFICMFSCFTQFTLIAYKSLIIVVEHFQKYHKKTQPVFATCERNFFIINERNY